MKLEFTNNALARMLDRGISESQVRAALEAPDHLSPCFEKRWHARKKIEARTLEVVFARQRAQSQIITVYWQEPAA